MYTQQVISRSVARLGIVYQFDISELEFETLPIFPLSLNSSESTWVYQG